MGVRKAAQHYATGLSRREGILDAAGALFRERGSGAPSLHDIAQAAGISRPGLLRYFASKEELLDALLDRYEARAAAEPGEGQNEPAPGGGLVARARRQAAVPGYVECLTSLSGEAVRADHPAHARMARRYRDLRGDVLRLLGPGADADAAACLLAGWEGMQLLALYSPSAIDVAACLERRLRFLAAPPPPPAGPHAAVPPDEAARRARVFRDLRAEDVRDLQERRGYTTGHERRRQLVEAATTLFGTRGFHGISLREMAKAVGISHSTLLHHFATKDDLLRAVLTHHDYLMITIGSAPDTAGEPARLAAVVETARRAAHDTPGLMELFSTVSAEAVAPAHPAHAYFAKHFAMSRRYLARSFEHLASDGELAAERDPAEEGLWLLAVCEGLQRLRLYDPDIDAAGLLAGELARTLGGPAAARDHRLVG